MAISGGLFTTRISLLSTYSFTNVFRSFVAVSIRPNLHNIQLQRRQQHFYLQTMASSAAALSEDAVEKISAPYGSWKSQITADVVSGGDKRLGGTAVDSNGRLFWLESRPTESGRSVLVMEAESPGGEARDITPKKFNVRTLAQEYGGGAFSVSGDTVVFSNYKDQRLYKQSISSKDTLPVPITPDYGRPVVSFANGVFDWRLNRFITVMEDGRESSVKPITTIATVSITDDCAQEAKLLVSGNDFYAFPRIDSTGTRVAWIEWCHPNMPWDNSELWVGYIDDNGDLYKRICVAGHDPKIVEAPSEPKWSPKGELYFVTDRHNGFWNLYKWNESNNEAIPLHPLDAEFTRPLWVFGINSYDFLPSEENKSLVACSYRVLLATVLRQNGSSHLGILDEEKKSLILLDVPYTDINNITSSGHYLFVEGASGAHPSSIAKVTLDAHKSKVGNFEIVWSSSPNCSRYASYLSFPEFIRFPTVVPGQEAYAYYYPPSNPYFKADSGEKPPLLLKSHGGPTGESRGILNMSIQYWTSRGWAFIDVNYGGSTGYGRDFRERLLGKWGIVDVDDCCSCAKFLVDSGKADGNRLCITGGSAGGYTTLAALAFKDTFKAGASLNGVADLSLLRAEIPKFESHYIDKLVGTDKDLIERSPVNYVDRFSCPIILFQGLEDKVVPPGQARKIYKALKEKGLPVALVEYEGEQHGFRKAENIKITLEQQMLFFARTVGNFKVADDITPIRIDNFD